MSEPMNIDDDEREDELVDKTEPELVKLWRVWVTAREMCADRGYEFTADEISIPLSRFKDKYSNSDGSPNRPYMNFSARPSPAMLAKYTNPISNHDPDPQPAIGTVWVEFNGDHNVGIKQMRTFAHHIANNNFHTGIFISLGSITAAALKIIPTVQPRVIETFSESDLLVNITRHELVPKHVLLSQEEKKALLLRYRVKETQLPRIQQGDPVARYLGLRRGQVVKIIRKSETAGRYASYRFCL